MMYYIPFYDYVVIYGIWVFWQLFNVFVVVFVFHSDSCWSCENKLQGCQKHDMCCLNTAAVKDRIYSDAPTGKLNIRTSKSNSSCGLKYVPSRLRQYEYTYMYKCINDVKIVILKQLHEWIRVRFTDVSKLELYFLLPIFEARKPHVPDFTQRLPKLWNKLQNFLHNLNLVAKLFPPISHKSNADFFRTWLPGLCHILHLRNILLH